MSEKNKNYLHISYLIINKIYSYLNNKLILNYSIIEWNISTKRSSKFKKVFLWCFSLCLTDLPGYGPHTYKTAWFFYIYWPRISRNQNFWHITSRIRKRFYYCTIFYCLWTRTYYLLILVSFSIFFLYLLLDQLFIYYWTFLFFS